MPSFDAYKRSLDAEYRAQLQSALQMLELPVVERVEASRALAGLLYQGADGRRTAHHVFHYAGQAGRFRSGDFVFVSPAEPEPRGVAVRDGVAGVIEGFEAGRVIVHVARSAQDTPFTPGVAYVVDERPPSWAPNYQRLSLALSLAEFSHSHGKRLDAMLEGRLAITDVDEPCEPPADLGGERAAEAFRRAVRRNLTAVQGPPGTGKTYLLARVVREFVRRDLRVVLCGFTHRAVNNALAAMLRAGVPPEALGKVAGGDESDLPAGVSLIDKREYWRAPRRGFVAAMTVYAAFEPFTQALYASARRTRTRLPEREQVDDATFWADLNRYNRDVVQTARLPESAALADVIVFDEAGQLTVPMALCGLAVAPRAVLFGDHAQLPPIGAAADTYPSIFHLVAERYPEARLRLNTSYRLNRALCAFPARAFYEGDLAAAPENANRTLAPFASDPAYARVFAPEPASVLAVVEHVGAGQVAPLEAALVADMAVCLWRDGGLSPAEGLAILSPHRRQNTAIRQALAAAAARRGVPQGEVDAFLATLLVDTVDRMQGQERDVILYSLTASDEATLDNEREFLFMPNRFNVAVTRARKKLVVVGSRRFFHHVPQDLRFARWQGAEGVQTRRMLDEANAFKRWYLEHRAEAVDLTAHAATLLAMSS